MRWILALVVAGSLSLGMTRTSHAQVAVGVSPWGGYGLAVGNPYGYYSSGYYGLGIPTTTTTVYSSGYYGVAPLSYGVRTFAYPTAYSYGYFPSYGYNPGFGYGYGGFGRWRGGWYGGPRYGRFW